MIGNPWIVGGSKSVTVTEKKQYCLLNEGSCAKTLMTVVPKGNVALPELRLAELHCKNADPLLSTAVMVGRVTLALLVPNSALAVI